MHAGVAYYLTAAKYSLPLRSLIKETRKMATLEENETVYPANHNIKNRSRDLLKKAMSKYQINDIQKMLQKHQSLIGKRDSQNGNLLLHDIVDDTLFNLKDEIRKINENRNQNDKNDEELALLVKNVATIMRILVENGVRWKVGGDNCAGGLFELNREKIDFVAYKHQTPFDMLLTKFEMILEYCMSTDNNVDLDLEEEAQDDSGSSESSIEIDENSNKDENIGEEVQDVDTADENETVTPLSTKQIILKNITDCIQYCIDVSKQAWDAKGCDDGYTIMNTAIGVFPLLKIETLKHLYDKFHRRHHQCPSSIKPKLNSNNVDLQYCPYAFQSKDLFGRTVLIKAIHEATKRTQWGDWEERFQMLLGREYGGLKQCWIRDENGRLPIHVAIERGLKWENGLKELAKIDSTALLESDPLTGLFPHAIMAVGKSADLNLAFNLLMMNPFVLKRYNVTKSRKQTRGRKKKSFTRYQLRSNRNIFSFKLRRSTRLLYRQP